MCDLMKKLERNLEDGAVGILKKKTMEEESLKKDMK